MSGPDKVNILLVDDQPAKLLSYEVILRELNENLLRAGSAREAFEHLLKTEVAVVLVDVVMPELDGFELAAMIREHPRFRETAIIFISAIHLTDVDRLRGYEAGAVDYVSVPVVPEILRAKVRVFADLFRKTRQLERLNRELERRVAERTADLEASTARLRDSERRRTLALAAGHMGSWDWVVGTGELMWDEGQNRIFGIEAASFRLSMETAMDLVHPDDRERLRAIQERAIATGTAYDAEHRIRTPSGEMRWCFTAAAPTLDAAGRVVRLSGVTHDITERKRAEERQQLLLRELNHRVKNTLTIVQSMVLQTQRHAGSLEQFNETFIERLAALSRTHDLLTRHNWESASLGDVVRQTLVPFDDADTQSARFEVSGPDILLSPNAAVTLGMAVHELATNAVKYGALSNATGRVSMTWHVNGAGGDGLPTGVEICWCERGGPQVVPPKRRGFGSRLVERGLAHELNGQVTLDFAPTGVDCRIRLPRSEKVQVG